MSDMLWYLIVTVISGIALFRWHRFNALLAKLVDRAETVIGSTAANVLRVVMVGATFIAIIYFFTSTIQYFIKFAVFNSCLPNEGVIRRILSCIFGNPFRYIRT